MNLGEDKQTIISYAVKVTKHAWNLEEIRDVICPLEPFDISLQWLEILEYVVLCLERSMFIPLFCSERLSCYLLIKVESVGPFSLYIRGACHALPLGYIMFFLSLVMNTI